MELNINKKLVPTETDEKYFRTDLYDTPRLVTNSNTMIYTDSLATCIGIAVCAKDENNIVHRIVCHCPYCPPADYSNLEGQIQEYLKSIGKITELTVKLASFDTFFEKELCEEKCERSILIIDRINEMVSFWKKNHPDFEIEIVQSTIITITPDGKFGFSTDEDKYNYYMENVKWYEQWNKEYETIFSEESTTLSNARERINKFLNNEISKSK